MAITIFQQKKRQQYLIMVLVIVILAIIFVVWQGFLSGGMITLTEQKVPLIQKEIKINFDVLKDPQLENLQPLEELPLPQEEEFGRENPFVPY